MGALNNSTTFERVSVFLEPFYSNIIIALVILLIGLIVGKVLGRLALKLLSEIEVNKIFKLATGMSVKLDKLISSIISYFFYVVFAMWALEKLGLSSVILNILAGGIIILVVVAVVLGIKDFFPNVIAGLFIHAKKIVSEGEVVEIDSVKGTVVHVGLVETELKSVSGDRVLVPNAAFLKSRTIKIKNSKIKKK